MNKFILIILLSLSTIGCTTQKDIYIRPRFVYDTWVGEKDIYESLDQQSEMEHWSEPTYTFNYDSLEEKKNYYPQKDSVYYKFYRKKRLNTKAFFGEEIEGNKYKAIAIIIDNKKDTLVIDVRLNLLYKNKMYKLTNEGYKRQNDLYSTK
ncbi:hypothetical protein [Flammeovirga sp. SJP92]|uniref:hypothetical protein n=1 Tax=Flammeovirga sp. SJP92 TaxID=1775430 RepID=UPI000786E77F|nr:hypothetical protein [Flammeovirga sp. SJP92]KXX70794.1 hypothetical protein AVL50_07085 [Flammeovirga sp. SJP92]